MIGKIIEKTAPHIRKFKFFTAIFPGLGAVLLIFLKDPISNSTKLAFNYGIDHLHGKPTNHYSINYVVIFYYIIVILWIILYALFITHEGLLSKENSDKNKDHLDQIKAEINSAIHNAPERTIFSRYKLLYDEIFNEFQLLENHVRKKTQDPEIYVTTFRNVLDKITLLTKEFSKKTDAIYGANIMRYIVADQNLDYIRKLREDPEVWIHFRKLDLDYLRSVLYGVSELIVTGKEDRKIPSIALPIFAGDDDDVLLLPGACEAVLKGEFLINDVTDLDVAGYRESQKKEAKSYFETAGNQIKSIISIAIPVSGIAQEDAIKEKLPRIIAVLNIDCDTTYPIGTDRDYFPTYTTLLRPIAYLFSSYLEAYFKLLTYQKG